MCDQRHYLYDATRDELNRLLHHVIYPSGHYTSTTRPPRRADKTIFCFSSGALLAPDRKRNHNRTMNIIGAAYPTFY